MDNCRIVGKTRVSLAQSCCFLSFYRSPRLWANNRDASNWIRRSVWRIHYFHIAHDALCPATFCINIVFNFSWLLHSPLTIFFLYFWCGGGRWGRGKHGTLWAMRKCWMRPIAVKRRRRHVYELPISLELYLIWLTLPFYKWGHSAPVYQFFGHLKNCVHFNWRWRLLLLYQADVAKMRAGLHESQTQKETFDAEAKRYKVRFTDNAAVYSRTFNDVLKKKTKKKVFT